MSNDTIKIVGSALLLLIGGGQYIYENRKAIFANFSSFWNKSISFVYDSFKRIFPSTIFKEKEIEIILKYLEKKYMNELNNDLTDLSLKLINDQKFLIDLTKKVEKIYSEKKFKEKKKKIFLVGDTGVGKSTLINCLEEVEEGNILALEAKIDAPCTMEYKEYNSKKYENYIFCDTRGIEKNNFDEIEKANINIIKEKVKDLELNLYLFWFLKGSSSNFQELDAKFIKSIEKSLNGIFPLFFIITKSIDDVKEKERLNNTIKEYFPLHNHIPIFPIMARASNRVISFGLKELMTETHNYFQNYILEQILSDQENNEKYQETLKTTLNNKSTIKEILKINLNHIKFEEYSKDFNEYEKPLIEDFYGKYQEFIRNNINNIIELCCILKAKYEVIDVNDCDIINEILINNNNSNEVINENDLKAQFLNGLSDSDKKTKFESKVNEYKLNKNLRVEIDKIINWLFSNIFINKLKNIVIFKIKERLFD